MPPRKLQSRQLPTLPLSSVNRFKPHRPSPLRHVTLPPASSSPVPEPSPPLWSEDGASERTYDEHISLQGEDEDDNSDCFDDEGGWDGNEEGSKPRSGKGKEAVETSADTAIETSSRSRTTTRATRRSATQKPTTRRTEGSKLGSGSDIIARNRDMLGGEQLEDLRIKEDHYSQAAKDSLLGNLTLFSIHEPAGIRPSASSGPLTSEAAARQLLGLAALHELPTVRESNSAPSLTSEAEARQLLGLAAFHERPTVREYNSAQSSIDNEESKNIPGGPEDPIIISEDSSSSLSEDDMPPRARSRRTKSTSTACTSRSTSRSSAGIQTNLENEKLRIHKEEEEEERVNR